MLDFPIIDTHVHFWDPGRFSYPWLANFPRLQKTFLLDDFDAARGPVDVEKIVFVEAACDPSQCAGETDWITSLAERDPRLDAIVAGVPLEKGDAVRPELERLSENRLVKGVRRIIEDEPDPGFCLRPDFIRGVQAVGDFELSFDVCIAHVQMDNTIELLRQCPGVRFVLDHIGKPDIKGRTFDPWKAQLKTLAAMPNVWCKISGLATEADHEHWTREDLEPYIDHVLQCFGFDRVMYGGDWPVAALVTGYPRWVETLARAVQGCSDAELRKLFRDNAIAFYRLATGAPTDS